MQQSFEANQKNISRKCGIRARENLSPGERAEKSRRLCEMILASDEFKNASTIMLYKAFRAEADLSAIMKAAASENKHFCFPVCFSKSQMKAYEPLNDESWSTGLYGIKEPVPEKSRECAPEEIGLIICPCTAFDEECHRIGMGAGYYDRFLPKCVNAVIISAAFEVQKQDSVPVDRLDIPMDAVFTEKTVYYNKTRVYHNPRITTRSKA